MLRLQSNKNIIVSTVEDSGVLILKVSTSSDLPLVLRFNVALILEKYKGESLDGFGLVFSKYKDDSNIAGVQYIDERLHYLVDGDVIRVNPRKSLVRAIYRINGSANFLFVTERCNSFCLMCSQPPRKVDDGYLIEELIRAIPLINKGARELGITGGEPTLLGERFFQLVRTIKNYLPSTAVHVLTNGRSFSNSELASQLAGIGHKDLMLGIPLYSDVSHIHDFVVQADGAFDETIRGILNLKRHSQKVEIRVVIHKQTYSRLPQLAEFIGRNLQFVDHVALMGLEITGFTRANLSELWIDPPEYSDQLSRAVKTLKRFGIRTSIYNHQLCLLPESLWRYSVKSISDWKNKYYEACSDCEMKNDCGGFFSSSDIKRSQNIKAIKTRSPKAS